METETSYCVFLANPAVKLGLCHAVVLAIRWAVLAGCWGGPRGDTAPVVGLEECADLPQPWLLPHQDAESQLPGQ